MKDLATDVLIYGLYGLLAVMVLCFVAVGLGLMGLGVFLVIAYPLAGIVAFTAGFGICLWALFQLVPWWPCWA